MTLLKKVQDVEIDVASNFVGRFDEVRMAIVALLSKAHMCFVGEPGCAKSDVIQQVAKRIRGANYFRKLVFGDTPDTDILGMYSLKSMKKDDVYRRNTEGFLPTAHVAFIDEVFRASADVLPCLHDVMKERLFRNGTKDEECPLVSMFAATNFYPLDRDLMALWDRFLLRRVVQPLSTNAQRRELLTLVQEPPRCFIDLGDLYQVHSEVAEVTVTEPIMTVYLDALMELESGEIPIHITDRRFRESLPILKAHAWLNGRKQTSHEDLDVLRHVLWSKEQEIKPVNDLINELGVSLMASIQALVKDVEAEEQGLSEKPTDLVDSLTTMREKCELAAQQLDVMERRACTNEERKAVTEADERVAELLLRWKDKFTKCKDFQNLSLDALGKLQPKKTRKGK